MPPQKKGAKELTKQTQKISKQLEHVQQFITQEIDSSDEDNNSVQEKIKPEDGTSNQRRPQRVSSKDDAPLRQQTTTRTRGQQAAAVVSASITPSKIVPSKKIDGKVETQQVNKNNGKVTPINSSVTSKKETNIIPIIPHSSRFISKTTNNKPAENLTKKNLIDLSQLEEELDVKKKSEGMLKTSRQLGLDDIPLRQARKTTSIESNKSSQLPKSNVLPLRQQNTHSSPIKLIKTTPMKGKITEIEEPKKKESKSNLSEQQNSEVSSGDKKQLTANELQAMSKLLSIQADGLKIKQQQQQQQQQLMQYQYSQQQFNRQYNGNNGFGEQPMKKIKMDYSSPFFTATTSSNHIIVGDNDTDTADVEEIDDSQFDSQETDQSGLVDSNNIFPIDQQRLVQCGTPLILGNVTPQSKTFNLQQQQKQQQQQRACSYLQTLSSLGPQPPRPALGKATPIQGSAAAPITITGKTTPISQMNPANKLTTPLRTFPGKVTSLNTSGFEQQQMNTWGEKVTPLNGKIMPNNGKITPLQRINTTFFNTQQLQQQQQQQQIQQQKQEQQHNLIDIETEIQSRIESIKNEIGPLLACLNSDFIGGGSNNSSVNQPSRPSDQQTNNQLQNSTLRTPPLPLISESRIYQDMRDRRMHGDSDNRTITPIINPHNNQTILPSTTANTRNFTPNVSSLRNATPNLSQINRNITPTRMPAHTRVGDWVCANCKNLNFSYRAVCNRCSLSHADNEMMIRNTSNNENIFISSCNNLLKKTPIRTVEDVKRTFQDNRQNKENMNMSNFPSNTAFTDTSKGANNNNIHFQNNQDSSLQQKNQSNINNANNNIQPKPTSTYGQNKGKRSTLSYKQLQEMGFENDPVLKIPSIQTTSNSSGQNTTTIEETNSTNNNNNNLTNVQTQQSSKETTTSNTASTGLVTHKIVFIDNSSAAPIVEISKKEQMKNTQESSTQPAKEANKRIAVDPRMQMR